MKPLAMWIGASTLICAVGASLLATEDGGRMPGLDGAVSWINSPPLSNKSLRGKVVLVNFWTYSCINSLRELPYVKGWAAKYKDAGLVVIGVHTPEFGFEKDPANVRTAVADLAVSYPAPVDSDRAIWSAFRNQYWPGDYFFDRRGRLRHSHFGEGDYGKSELVIRQLLAEGGSGPLPEGPVSTTGTGIEAPPSEDVRSPETFAGYERTERFASREKLARDTRRLYNLPQTLSLNQWALGGSWIAGPERATLQAAGGRVVFRFHSRDVHMVLGPGRRGTPVRFKVTIDGAPPNESRGTDSLANGTGEVREPRLYQLIRQQGPVRARTFEIEFLDPGVEAFSFTFG